MMNESREPAKRPFLIAKELTLGVAKNATLFGNAKRSRMRVASVALAPEAFLRYGGRMSAARIDVDTHSKTIGYILWIFGFFGAHRFYYGKPVSGTIWFFTLGLLGIGWIVDLFLIPSMDREAGRRFARGRYDYNAAWILLTFLGIFGVHRFYLGKWLSGLVWFFTGGLFALGYLYDYWTLNSQVSESNSV